MDDDTNTTDATLHALNRSLDTRNFELLCERAAAYVRRTGPQVGDFVEMMDGTVRRFAHDWGEDIQVTCTGSDSSFYLSMSGASFSGSLDAPVLKEDLRDTGKTRSGEFWFFKNNSRRAHNGVNVMIICRIWRLQQGRAT